MPYRHSRKGRRARTACLASPGLPNGLGICHDERRAASFLLHLQATWICGEDHFRAGPGTYFAYAVLALLAVLTVGGTIMEVVRAALPKLLTRVGMTAGPHMRPVHVHAAAVYPPQGRRGGRGRRR